MAAQIKLFKQLLWLVDTIYSEGEITRDEIERKWVKSASNDDKIDEYGERNFHRHRSAVYELFGIEIVYDRETKKYSLKRDDNGIYSPLRSWMIDMFAINNVAKMAQNMHDVILPENIPAGTQFLSKIVVALREKRKLQITYKRFDRAEPHTFLLDPYCMKVFHQRWYLIGKPDDHPEETEPRVYALDRVRDINMTTIRSVVPKQFKATDFFKNQFGVDRTTTTVEHVVIKVQASAANYFRTLPKHHSQTEIEHTEEYSIFAYDIALTYDFIQELRKHGSFLEVLEPSSLRNQFIEESRKMVQIYCEQGRVE